MHAIYKDVAAKHGLTLSPLDTGIFTKTLLLRARAYDEEVLVQRFVGGSQRITRALVREPGDLGLSVTPTGVFTPLTEMVAGKDMQLGEPESIACLQSAPTSRRARSRF